MTGFLRWTPFVVRGTARAALTIGAVLLLIEPVSALLVTVEPSPESRPNPGGDFTYRVTITPEAGECLEPCTLTGLEDSVYGDVLGQGTCDAGATVPEFGHGPFECEFSGSFSGSEGDEQTNSVTATVHDDALGPIDRQGTGSATVRIDVSAGGGTRGGGGPTANITERVNVLLGEVYRVHTTSAAVIAQNGATTGAITGTVNQQLNSHLSNVQNVSAQVHNTVLNATRNLK